jgi:O-antigen ligase
MVLFVSPRWRLVLITGFIIALVIIISYAVGRSDGDIVGDTLGLSGRVEIWSRALLAIRDFPLTGVGLNGFRDVVHVLYPLFSISSEIDLGHSHNHLLQAALDVGLAGLVAYLALWFISGGLLWTTGHYLARRKAKDHPYYVLAAGLAGSMLAGWVFGAFDAIALGARPSFVWWLVLGLTTATHYAVAYSGKRLRLRQRSSVIAPTSPTAAHKVVP